MIASDLRHVPAVADRAALARIAHYLAARSPDADGRVRVVPTPRGFRVSADARGTLAGLRFRVTARGFGRTAGAALATVALALGVSR